MKVILVFVGLFLLATAVAQQRDESSPKGVIHGTVIGQDGKPAKGIRLRAWPLGLASAQFYLTQERTMLANIALKRFHGGGNSASKPKMTMRDTRSSARAKVAMSLRK
jgi:hypothetical protein